MTTDTKHKLGRRPEDILEREAGSVESLATLLCELGGAVEAAVHWFPDEGAGTELVRVCRELDAILTHLYLTTDGELTGAHECPACGGNGWYSGGRDAPRKDCDECGATGVDPFSTGAS